MEDLESPSATCEMCESQQIRYVHYMEHDDFDKILAVGCVCAQHMEEDFDAPRTRERELRNTANRRRNWLKRKWKISSRGNPYILTDGFRISVYQVSSSRWGARIVDLATQRYIKSKLEYATEDEVKLAAFNTMILLKEKYGLGN